MPSAPQRVAIVTGCAGFLGSHVTSALLAAQWRVIGVDDLSTGRIDNFRAAQQNPAFELRRTSVSSLPTRLTGNVLVHLAGRCNVASSRTACAAEAEENETALHRLGAERVIAASSAACEASPPQSPYGELKRGLERALANLPRRGLALRFFNVYGPRQRPETGAVVPAIAHAILTGREVVIHGDGEQTRDFLFIDDAVDAVVRAVGANPLPTRPLAIGTGVATSINSLVGLLQEIIGRQARVRFAPSRPGDLRDSCADPAAAEAALGFAARVKLEEGLAQTVAWLRHL